MREVYIGIDTHKESNVLASAFAGRDEPKLIGKVSADLNRTLDETHVSESALQQDPGSHRPRTFILPVGSGAYSKLNEYPF
jgi:hypothetical protein